jgi:hypothetical protein
MSKLPGQAVHGRRRYPVAREFWFQDAVPWEGVKSEDGGDEL